MNSETSRSSQKMIFLTLMVLMPTRSYAKDYKVGNPYWVLNLDYITWAATTDFYVGDRLIFNYNQYTHNVVEVADYSDYTMCNVYSPLRYYTSGYTIIQLNSPGTRYFACSNYCLFGMRFSLTVRGSPRYRSPPPYYPTTPTSYSYYPPPPYYPTTPKSDSYYPPPPYYTTTPTSYSYYPPRPYYPTTPETNSGSSKPKAGVIVGVVGVIIFIAALIGICLVKQHRAKEQKQPENPIRGGKKTSGNVDVELEAFGKHNCSVPPPNIKTKAENVPNKKQNIGGGAVTSKVENVPNNQRNIGGGAVQEYTRDRSVRSEAALKDEQAGVSGEATLKL